MCKCDVGRGFCDGTWQGAHFRSEGAQAKKVTVEPVPSCTYHQGERGMLTKRKGQCQIEKRREDPELSFTFFHLARQGRTVAASWRFLVTLHFD